MRILYFTNNLKGLDGWSTYSLDLIEEMRKRRHEILCLTSEKSDQQGVREETILKRPLKYFNSFLQPFLTSLKVSSVIKEFSPDIIHFMVEPYANILPFLFGAKGKFCLTIHGTYAIKPLFYSRLSYLLSRQYYKKLNGLVSVSRYTLNELLKNWPEISRINQGLKAQVINNGINLEKHKISSLGEKPLNKIKKILFVGQIKSRKGILQSVEALKYYRDNFADNFIYDIVGKIDEKSDYLKSIRQKLKEYKLENNIFFRGEVSAVELENYYKNADCFLMLAINENYEFEGFGLVYLEANSKGVPCIGSINCGAQDAILNGITGFVVDPCRPMDIAQKISFILEKSKIKVDDCIDWVKKHDIKIKAGELIEFYQSLIG